MVARIDRDAVLDGDAKRRSAPLHVLQLNVRQGTGESGRSIRAEMGVMPCLTAHSGRGEAAVGALASTTILALKASLAKPTAQKDEGDIKADYD